MDDYYDEDEVREEEAKEEIDAQLNESLSFTIDLSHDLGPYISRAIDRVVGEKVEKALGQAINNAVKEKLVAAIDKIVDDGLSMPVKKYDYSGNVTEERSFKDLILAEMGELQKEGLNYKLRDKNGYSSSTKSIEEIIKDDIYLMIKEKLKPQFDLIEKDFKAQSQAALRSFAVAAVDNATKGILGGR